MEPLPSSQKWGSTSAYTWEPVGGSTAFANPGNWMNVSTMTRAPNTWVPSSSDTLTFDNNAAGGNCDISGNTTTGTVYILSTYTGTINVLGVKWTLYSGGEFNGGTVQLTKSAGNVATLDCQGCNDWTGTKFLGEAANADAVDFDQGSTTTVRGANQLTCTAILTNEGTLTWTNTGGLTSGAAVGGFMTILGGVTDFDSGGVVPFTLNGGSVLVNSDFYSSSITIETNTTLSLDCDMTFEGDLTVAAGAKLTTTGSVIAQNSPGDVMPMVTLIAGCAVDVNTGGGGGLFKVQDGELVVSDGSASNTYAAITGNLTLVNSDASLVIGENTIYAAGISNSSFTVALNVTGNFDCGHGTYTAELYGWYTDGFLGGDFYAGAELSVGGNADTSNGSFISQYDGSIEPAANQAFQVFAYGGTLAGAWGGGICIAPPWISNWGGKVLQVVYTG